MTDEYKALALFVRYPNWTLKQWASRLEWVERESGKPDAVRVHTALVTLSISGLVTHRGDYKGWAVTRKGAEFVRQIKEI